MIAIMEAKLAELRKGDGGIHNEYLITKISVEIDETKNY